MAGFPGLYCGHQTAAPFVICLRPHCCPCSRRISPGQKCRVGASIKVFGAQITFNLHEGACGLASLRGIPGGLLTLHSPSLVLHCSAATLYWNDPHPPRGRLDTWSDLKLNRAIFMRMCLVLCSLWDIPANTIPWAKVGSMLDQRRRRWVNIDLHWFKVPGNVFAGIMIRLLSPIQRQSPYR